MLNLLKNSLFQLLQYKKKCQDLEDTVHTKDIEITRVYNNKVKKWKYRLSILTEDN